MTLEIRQIMRTEPKELATFASDAYHEGVKDALNEIRNIYGEIDENALNIIERIYKKLMARCFQAVENRKSEWIDGLDHSISPSKTYISMPIEEYHRLKALDS